MEAVFTLSLYVNYTSAASAEQENTEISAAVLKGLANCGKRIYLLMQVS